MNSTLYFVTLQTQLPASGASGQQGALDVWKLLAEATPVVKLVMIVLVVMSLVSWFIIGAKLVRLATATHASRRFLDAFWEGEGQQGWSGERLESIYVKARELESSPVAATFRAGYVELARIASGQAPAGGDLENVERALRRASQDELTRIENFVPFLATTGSTAPFVGLFGTVWGIMNSFIAIHGNKNASLDVVAPGIAEALIATAIGLAAAIPAVMAYNYFVRRIRVLEAEIEAFSSDYLNIVRRYFLTR
ncbi:MAG: protein TolQ [Myxococcota bacterium]|nr:protein TolQ [Myxococcota bacterium]MDW8362624.1 protein TolQ [Myxococcales bacterium]